jgi:rubrerythrin
MAQFIDPFTGVIPDRPLSDSELVRTLRMSLAAEHEAVHLYMAQADATTNKLAKKVLKEIADEERVHAGEFMRLIAILTGDEDTLLAKGKSEVDEIAGEK